MSRRAMLLMLVFAVAAVGIGVVLALWDRGGQDFAPIETGSGVIPGESPRTYKDTIVDAPRAKEASGTEGAAEPDLEALLPAGLFVSGQVIDAVSRKPVTPYRVRLFRKAEESDKTTKRYVPVAEEVVRNQDGRFQYELDRETSCYLIVTSACYPSKALDDIRVSADNRSCDLVIELEPGLQVAGRVIDDESGRPISGAIVASSRHSSSILRDLGADDFEQRFMHATTGEDGRFMLDGLKKGRHRIGAFHPGYAGGCTTCEAGGGTEIEIRLGPGYCIFGTVLDDRGQPSNGALVQVVGDKVALTLYSSTDAEGRYRTLAVSPGEAEVFAGPPYGEREESFGLSSEWKVAHVEDRDVEVNFGPLPEHIEWRGVLYGYDGAPQPGGSISLNRSVDFGAGKRHRDDHRWTVCNEEGRFVFRRLLPGAYDVSLRLGNGTRVHNWKTIALDTPGLIEEDIRLDRLGDVACGEISGIIVDALTGVAPQAKYVFIRAYSQGVTNNSYKGRVDEDGRFSIRGLPPDTYQVSVHASDYPATLVQDIRVAEGESVDDLRIEVNCGGTLRIILAGFHDQKNQRFNVHTRHLNMSDEWTSGGQIGEDGSADSEISKDPGQWLVGVSVVGVGLAQRTCSIVAGQTTTIELCPEDLAFSGRPASIEGRLLRSDGSPVTGAELNFSFSTRSAVGDRSALNKNAVTNKDGGFKIDGLRPGFWSVSFMAPGACETRLREISIARDASDPVSMDLIFPEGTVSGIVRDGHSGEPSAPARPNWWLSVRDHDTDSRVAILVGGWNAPKFHIGGIPAGTYYVAVWAGGFKRYESESFEHPGKGNVDLGTIVLERCGVLILEVVDENGLPIKGCHALFDGQTSWDSTSESLPPGQRMYYSLPLGEVSVEVRARGFRTGARRVKLNSDRTEKLRIKLERQ